MILKLETDQYHFFLKPIPIFSIFSRYLASCQYFIHHWYRYSQICLPIYLPLF